MSKFLVEFADEEIGNQKTFQFEATTPARAFRIVEEEGGPCHIQVWRDKSFLGDIFRDRIGIWHLNEELDLDHWEP